MSLIKLYYEYLKNKAIYLLKHDEKYKLKYKNAKQLIKFYIPLKKKITEDTFFVIGDSHTDIFHNNNIPNKFFIGQSALKSNLWGCLSLAPKFVTYHLDACLAYNMNKYGTTMKGREKIDYLIKYNFLPKGAKIILSFGEIDCRVHVLKQSEARNLSIEAIVDEIIDNYFDLVKYLKDKKYKVYCYAPIATQKDDNEIDPAFPRYGSEIERNKVSLLFGEKLKQRCEKYNVGYISVIKHLLNDDLTTKGQFYRDGVRLNMSAYEYIVDSIKELR